MSTLVADRYLVSADHWLDIATGRRVAGRMLSRSIGATRASACVEENAIWVDGARRLIDYGEASAEMWFEVWNVPDDGAAPLYAIRHLSRSVVTSVERAAEIADGRGPRVIPVRTCAGAGTGAVLSDIARALRRLGYVTIRADGWRPAAEIRRALCHRHVALIETPRARRDGSTTAWTEDLVRASNRAHLVLSLVPRDVAADSDALEIEPIDADALAEAFVAGVWQPSSDVIVAAAIRGGGWPGAFVRELEAVRSGSWSVHERAPAYGVDAPQPSSRFVLSRSLRADRCDRRGRRAAASRWSRAAFESAKRHRHEEASVAAFSELAARMRAEGRLDAIARIASRELKVVSASGHVKIAGIVARECVAAGETDRAEAWTALAITSAERCATPAPVALLAARAELRLWQGRFALGARELSTAPDHPLVHVWRGILAWAAGDRDVLDRANAAGHQSLQLDHLDDGRARLWQAALRVLAAHERGDGDAAALALRDLTRHADPTGPCREYHAFARVIARVLGRASNEPAPRVSHAHGASVFATLERWMRERECMADQGRQQLDLSGLAGFRRWTKRRTEMHALDNLSALLDIVHDGDDDQAALTHACAWTRTATRATAVGMFGVTDRRWLAGDRDALDRIDDRLLGETIARNRAEIQRGDGCEWAMSPVRYGGLTVAFVLAHGRVDEVASMVEACHTVASVCAPLVRTRLDAIVTTAESDALATEIIGTSPAMDGVRKAIARAAATPFSVLIEGESGTGKELAARALHRLGARRDRRFCALNCAALSDELFESEVFGHARGAFTGAVAARTGLFEEANRGTLFLDEVAELSPRAQAKLLRVLQEGEIRRVGENASRAVDVRLVAATNRPLSLAAANGQFREDLLFRLAVVRITLPPLRDRMEDLPPMAHAFWREASRRVNARAVLGADAIAALCRYSWPGNVRQLQNALSALAVAAPARGRVSSRHVGHVLAAQGGASVGDDVPLDVARRSAERHAVAAALARHGGRRSAAARELGLSRQGLVKAMRRLGLGDAESGQGVA